MCKKINEEKLLFDVSEESILKDWNSDTDLSEHQFSRNYEKFRQEMIDSIKKQEKTEIAFMPVAQKKKRFLRTPIGVAAAIVTVFVLSMGVYALSRLFTVNSEMTDESSGEITYTIEVDDEAPVTPMKIIMDYIPEGCVEREKDGDGMTLRKFRNEDNPDAGITVMIQDYSHFNTVYRVSAIEKTEISDVRADILTWNGDVECNHMIFMFYEDVGQIVTLMGYKAMSLEELKKTAENIRLEPTGEAVYIPETEEEKEVIYEESKPVADEQMVVLGEAMDMGHNITFTVKNIELKDDLQGMDERCFIYSMGYIGEYVNEDGSFKDVELGHKEWVNRTATSVVDVVSPVRLAYVTLEITNHSKELVKDSYVSTRIATIDEDRMEYSVEGEILSGWRWASGSEPIYYDSSDYLDGEYNKHMFASDFEGGETRTVHLAVPYMQIMEEDAYLVFRHWIGDLDNLYVKLVP